MYGRGGGPLSSSASGVSGAASTAAGLVVLPNTGGNLALTILSIATICLGALIVTSFVLARLFSSK